MAKRVKDLIIEALENLTDDDLKRFKRLLNETPVQPGYNAIPFGRLQKAKPLDVADIIVNFYHIDHGLRVTAKILDDINQRLLADRLLNDAGVERHFVDRHREAIIARTIHVLPILDRLLSQQLLTPEQYLGIRAKGLPQNMMRELFEIVPGWSKAGKDQLYEALKAQHHFVIFDLEGQ